MIYSSIHNSDITPPFLLLSKIQEMACVFHAISDKNTLKKPGKIVTLFADKGFWQYSAIPSKKFILSLLTFRNSLEILLWSCRSRFYKETYVYNYNSLVGEIPLPAYVPLNGPPLNVWVTSPFWLRYPNHSPCLGSENCKQREKLF